MEREISVSEITRKFMGGLDCSQVCFSYGSDLMDFDEEEALRIAAAFGGGLFKGRTCGCVTGCLMALGLKYGHSEPFDEEAKAKMMAVTNEFINWFEEEHGSSICKDLIGFDFSKGESQAAVESGVMLEKCPLLAKSACDRLAELLEEE